MLFSKSSCFIKAQILQELSVWDCFLQKLYLEIKILSASISLPTKEAKQVIVIKNFWADSGNSFNKTEFSAFSFVQKGI
jgi:hypothetical protein